MNGAANTPSDEDRTAEDASSVPYFSVVIPTFERNDLLARCLECLAPGQQEGVELIAKGEIPKTEILKSQECSDMQGLQEDVMGVGWEQVQAEAARRLPPASCFSAFPTYEVIVADDGRSSTAEAIIGERFPWARWVRGPGTGPAANRNAGAAQALGSWLVFTDDDCLPQPGWLRAFTDGMKEYPDGEVFEGEISAERPRKTLAEHAPVGGGSGNLWSCNFAIRRKIFAELGGFDAAFRVCMEDSDFALRVRQSGRTYPYLPEALVIHPWRRRQLAHDGWKSHSHEAADHLRYNRKHSIQSRVAALNLMRLAINSISSDLAFIARHKDLAGLPYAVANFLRCSQMALRYWFL
jgi:hypothetical protein